jgi:peptidoglycan/xylan/chitin deacetylase (PgdA/CDA1 family)
LLLKRDYGTDSIINIVVKNKHLGNGSIILMHNGAKDTPKELEIIIKRLASIDAGLL